MPFRFGPRKTVALWRPNAVSASFNAAINFRATGGFVTDGAGQTFNIGATGSDDVYPTTRSGLTFGWATNADVDARDRSAAVDARFAGMAFNAAMSYVSFRVDLPAPGSYTIRGAFGDNSTGQGFMTFQFLDNATPFGTQTSLATGGAANFLDATGVNRTSIADWIANNAAVVQTFASSTFFLQGKAVTGHLFTVAHLNIVKN